MARNKTHEFWKAQVEKWQDSGLSQAAFCEQEGHTAHHFSYWKNKLLKKKSSFVELKTGGSMSIKIDGKTEVTFTDFPDAKWLANFVGLLNAS